MARQLSDKNIVRLARYALAKRFHPIKYNPPEEFVYLNTNSNFVRYPIQRSTDAGFLVSSPIPTNTTLDVANIELKRFMAIGRQHKDGWRLHVLMDVGNYKEEVIFINRKTLVAEYRWEQPRKRTFTVSSIGREHIIGDEKCKSEWCDSGHPYPKRCTCGGLIHAEFGDEMEDGYYILTKCDKCGKDER